MNTELFELLLKDGKYIEVEVDYEYVPAEEHTPAEVYLKIIKTWLIDKNDEMICEDIELKVSELIDIERSVAALIIDKEK